MCSDAGMEEKTNHSLRVFGVTSLFAKQVPKKTVKERTGHRSLTVLTMYECTSSAQHKAVSSILSRSKRIFEEELHGEPSAKKAQVSTTGKEDDDIPMVVQNCVVNVYGRGLVDNVQPVQNNAFSASSSSDYETDMDDFFANVSYEEVLSKNGHLPSKVSLARSFEVPTC